MAEALTAIEVALAISSVVKGLYSYATSVKDAKQDIRRLTQELFALKSALEYFDLQSRHDIPADVRQQASEVLSLADETLKGVSTRLERAQSSRLRGAVVAATWPFKSGEMQKHIDSIERAKTWFVMVILQDGAETTRHVYDELKGLVQLVQEDIVERKTSEMTKETEILFKWLSPFDSSAQIAKAMKERAPGTGKWALREQFREWIEPQETKRPFLWISGKSGSGKTVLFSTFVEQLQAICAEHKPESRLIGYHCCSLDEAASQQMVNIFGSILAHIGLSQPGLLAKVAQHRRATSTLVPQNNLTLEQIHETFDTVAESTECVYVLVDALNEAPYTRALLVENLLGLCKRNANIRVLVTCTGMPSQSHELIETRSMDSTQVNLDIELYVRHRLQTDVGFANTSPDIKQQILSNIISNAQGMFRWAKLCMDRLSVLRTGRDIRDTLADMPRTLNDTYVGILDRVAAHDAPLARETLLWLCFSVRPLKLGELAEAVILRPGDTVMDDDSRLMNQMVLLDVCQGLAVRNDHGFITLAHDSVRSFLTSEHIRASRVAYFSLDHDASQAHIMKRCLLYLSLRPFSLGPVSTREESLRRKQAHPLLRYATFSWPLHSALFPLGQDDEGEILNFFHTKTTQNGGSFDSWVQSLLQSLDLVTIRQTQPLYYAASYNMVSILRLLLRPEFGVDVEQRGGRFRSPPLFIALWRHNWEAAEILLEAGADPLSVDDQTTCYELVSDRGQDESRIKMLMDLILATRDTRPDFGNGDKFRVTYNPHTSTAEEATQVASEVTAIGDVKMGEPSELPLR